MICQGILFQIEPQCTLLLVQTPVPASVVRAYHPCIAHLCDVLVFDVYKEIMRCAALLEQSYEEHTSP